MELAGVKEFGGQHYLPRLIDVDERFFIHQRRIKTFANGSQTLGKTARVTLKVEVSIKIRRNYKVTILIDE